MSSADVSGTVEEDIGYIRFENRATRNALTLENALALQALLESLAARPGVKAVVLAGTAEYFCTGGSMELLEELGASSVERRKEVFRAIQGVVLAMKRLPALVCAQFEGLAAGAGVDLLLACDQVVAADSARVNFSFSRLNMVPDLGGLFLLAQRTGHSRALDVYCRSETLGVQALRGLGLIDAEPVKTFEGYSWSRALRGSLSVSKEALAAAKGSLWASIAPQFALHLEKVTESVCVLMDTEQHRSAVRRTRSMQNVLFAAK